MRYILLLASLLFATALRAQTDIVKPDLSKPSLIAPAYFGPNAFPVPDMLDGRTSSVLSVELYGDYFAGTTGRMKEDMTGDIFARVTIPLFTSKANITVWMPIVESYYTSSQINAQRRLPYTEDLRGMDSGDVYVSTDISLLAQEKHKVDMAVRAALKSASANKFYEGRCYDAPGYFFDLSLGRGFKLGTNSTLRLAGSVGFLCWQTGNGRQNDAVMYGAKVIYRYRAISIDSAFGGYTGWEGMGDRPMTLKTNLTYHIGRLSIRLGHQVGFRDWPYHQLRVGACYYFDILRERKASS